MVISDLASCGSTIPLVEAAEEQRAVSEVLGVVTKATGSRQLNLWSRYCRDGECRTNDGDRWMFSNGNHVTVEESDALAPTFAELLRGDAMR